jgi:hypothetical protein
VTRERADVTALAASVLAVAVVLAIAHGGRPPALVDAPAWLASRLGSWARPVAVASALVALAYVLVELLRWTLLIPRALRTRIAFAILPGPDFDPRPEAIEAFGQQLLGVRRRVLAWLDRPACAIRVRLTTTADGRLLYAVEAPARFRGSLLNAYATAYPDVDVRPAEDVA